MNDQLKRAFDDVVAEDRLKENTRNYLHYRLYGKHRRTMAYGKLAAAFSLVLLLGLGGRMLYFTPVSFISIDINPSIELGLNRLDRIISVTPFNVDGVEAVENLELKNRKYDEAILMLLESREMSAYVTEDSQISISVVSDDQEKNVEIQQRVRSCTENRYENVSCHSSNEGVVQSAHHEGVSFGKYQAFLELQAVYPDITVDDVKNLTMSQIQDLMELYSETEGAGTDRSEALNSEIQNPETWDSDQAGPEGDDSETAVSEEVTEWNDDGGCSNNRGDRHGHRGGRCQY